MGGSVCVHSVSLHSSVSPSRRHLLVLRIRRVFETHSPTQRPSSPSGRSPSRTRRAWAEWTPLPQSASTRAQRAGAASRQVDCPGTCSRSISVPSRALSHNALDRDTSTPAASGFRHRRGHQAIVRRPARPRAAAMVLTVLVGVVVALVHITAGSRSGCTRPKRWPPNKRLKLVACASTTQLSSFLFWPAGPVTPRRLEEHLSLPHHHVRLRRRRPRVRVRRRSRPASFAPCTSG